jgi:hypothetical protein
MSKAVEVAGEAPEERWGDFSKTLSETRESLERRPKHHLGTERRGLVVRVSTSSRGTIRRRDEHLDA